MLERRTVLEIEARAATVVKLLGEAGAATEALLEFMEENMAAISPERQAAINYMHKQVGRRLQSLSVAENRFTRLGLSGRILN